MSVPAVPSGQPVALQDIRPEADGTRLRFRFVGAQIDETDFETTAEDMHHLCEFYALPWMTREGAQAEEIVISLAAREVPFGEAVPEVTQYFEAYRVEDGACVWELFQ
ncbi:hypothetical protein C2I36_05505 [Rhodobacteraceae bacterium WD3A24]|nr:hypothetical protein C2I36_05505 [Rhodobacteraceae bacterium WD3A24]